MFLHYFREFRIEGLAVLAYNEYCIDILQSLLFKVNVIVGGVRRLPTQVLT